MSRDIVERGTIYRGQLGCIQMGFETFKKKVLLLKLVTVALADKKWE